MPSEPLAGPEQVLDYLGRYTHRVAISNERIVVIDEAEVALRVRSDATTGKKRTMRLKAGEFIDRFLMPVLPSGFKRIRHYGLIGPAHKAARLAAARAALDAPAPDPVVVESVQAFMQRIGQPPVLALPALRPRPVRAHGVHCARAGALAASAGTAVRIRLPSRFVCRALGVVLRPGRARPLRPVHANRASHRACLHTLQPLLAVANASRDLIERIHRHAHRLHRAPAGLQSP